MFIKKYNAIMEKEEAHRNRWALGLSITLSLFIFLSWAFYKDFISFQFGSGTLADEISTSQVANVSATDTAPSPLENSKDTFLSAFNEIAKQYISLKKSISDVLVPFVTGIEVYERE